MAFLEKNSSLFSIIKGILISIVFTMISLTIFSALLVYTDLSEQTIKPVIIIFTGVSILLGSSVSTRKLKKNGLINGAIIGGIYIFLIYLISSILNSDFSLSLVSIIMIIVGIIGGILGGIIGVNT